MHANMCGLNFGFPYFYAASMIQKPWKRLLVLGILFMKCRLQVFVPGGNLNEGKLVQTKRFQRTIDVMAHVNLHRWFWMWPTFRADDSGWHPTDRPYPFRLLVLLRTTVEKPARGCGTTRKVFNVPFLLDTGSSQIFLCEDDYKILGIEAARNVYIEDVPCRPQISTEHFMDIKLLGTDVLKKTFLFVDYTNLTLHLGFFDQGGMGMKLSARLVYSVSFKIVYLHLILSYACICSHANWPCCNLPSFWG